MITLEAREIGGDWGTLNHFTDENKAVTTGQMSRASLVEIARRKLAQWQGNYDRVMEYRVADSEAMQGGKPSRVTRKPYTVTVRRMVNGADYSARLFLKDTADAFDAMVRRVRLTTGLPREALRLVSVEPAPHAPCFFNHSGVPWFSARFNKA
jgi:hypothetical protein